VAACMRRSSRAQRQHNLSAGGTAGEGSRRALDSALIEWSGRFGSAALVFELNVFLRLASGPSSCSFGDDQRLVMTDRFRRADWIRRYACEFSESTHQTGYR